jgi:DNA-binding response OmpR family regulator
VLGQYFLTMPSLPKRGPHIYIADPDPLISELVQFTLEEYGFNVTVCHDFDDAIISLKSYYDLYVIDIDFDIENHKAITDHIRHNPSSAGSPVILCSSHENEAQLIKGLDAGADDYIVKPFRMKEFVARVRALLRRVPDLKQ